MLSNTAPQAAPIEAGLTPPAPVEVAAAPVPEATPPPAAELLASRFPAPFRRIRFTKPGTRNALLLGTVTDRNGYFFRALLDGLSIETTFLDSSPVEALETAPLGMLPAWLFTGQRHAGALPLEAINYDLILRTTECVSECFYKQGRFLEIAGKHRHIALADVACLRPSA